MHPVRVKARATAPGRGAAPIAGRARLSPLRQAVLGAGAIVAGGWLVVVGWPAWTAWQQVARRPDQQLTWSRVHVTQPPDWIPPRFVPDLLQARDFPARLPLTRSGLAEDLAAAFASSPWVERVVSVRGQYPARVEVELVYRRPVALVTLPSSEVPIDGRGVLLQLTRQVRDAHESYPRIVGVKSSPAIVGQAWGDPVVTHAAALAEALSPHWSAWGLKAIECPNSPPRADQLESGEFRLRTGDGSVLLWGQSPLSEHPGSIPTELKIARIGQYLKQFSSFAEAGVPQQIDLRPLREITRKPLPASGP